MPSDRDEDATRTSDGPPLVDVASAWRKAAARLESGAGSSAVDGGGLRVDPGRTVFGRYELRDALGCGGCGTVHRAWDPRHEREVALKVVHRTDEQARARFDREVKATARLRHPGIVPLLDSGEQDRKLFLVTELISGGSLAARIETAGRLPAEEAARVVRDVALALHYAHGEGILHRDIKPHNVLLDAAGRARVVDFGLARLEERADRLTATGATLGTPAYMPPEQVDARGFELDARSDVYSLGATLYDALTGRPPFDASSVEELLLAVLRTEPTPPSTHDRRVPADLDTICLKCLDKDPDRRYATAGDLAADLERFLTGDAVQARPQTTTLRAWRWTRRNPVVTALTLVILVLSLALAAVTWRYVTLLHHLERDAR